LTGIAHSTFAYAISGHNKLFAAAVTGLPLIVAGALLLVSRMLSAKEST
jgi:hypothetical protein